MAYEVPFSDEPNKGRITVEDKSFNTSDTSLQLIGRLVSDYGLALNTNFLHLLENFADVNAPLNPVEGQLWYDTTDGIDQLKIYDGTNWVAAGGLKKGGSEPEAGNSVTGDLWVDTTNSQLYLYTGSGWVLVGPSYSTGAKAGALPETIIDTSDVERTVIINYAYVAPATSTIVSIISAEEFRPKSPIAGYSNSVPIKIGINPNKNLSGIKFNGTANVAENLLISGATIQASDFMRTNVVNQLTEKLLIRNNGGIEVGIAKTISVIAEGTTGLIQNSLPGANIDFRVNNSGTSEIPIRIKSNTNIGVNNLNPNESLDVGGVIQTDTKLNVTGTEDNTLTSSTSGSIQTAGGIGIAKNAYVGQNLNVQGNLTTGNVIPQDPGVTNLGGTGNAFNVIRGKTITAENKFVGYLEGNISGGSVTAGKLTSPTTFRLQGDVSSPNITFDGQIGGNTKTFTTTIDPTFVSGKSVVTSVNGATDTILVNQSGTLVQATPDTIFGTVQTIPVGTVTMYAGTTAPAGWFFCDGSEKAISTYGTLASTLGHNPTDPTTWYWGTPSDPNTVFVIPDYRGRLPVGLGLPGGANRITNAAAGTLGGVAGSDEVTITQANIPEHEHDLKSSTNEQFYTTTTATATAPEVVAGSGDTAGTGTRMVTSGGVVDLANDPIDITNPFAAINFIIYHGVT